MKRQTINAGLTLCGGLTVISGLLMLFHYESHFTTGIHELSALGMVFFCIWHVKANWKPLLAAFKNRKAVCAVFGALALCTLLMLAWGSFGYKEESLRGLVQEKFGVELPAEQK